MRCSCSCLWRDQPVFSARGEEIDITTFFTPRKLLAGGLLLLILIFLATFPLYAGGYHILVLSFVLMFTILTVSWVMFSGSTGYISLAPAAFLGVGMYTTALLFERGKELLPLPAVIAVGGLSTLILALLVGPITLRLRGVYFTVFSFGFVIFMRELVRYREHHILGGVVGRYVARVNVETSYYIMVGILVATLLAVYFIRRSRYGLALQSIGENEEAAAHMGVNTTMMKVIFFAISSFFMGAAGAAIAPQLRYIDPATAFSLRFSFLPVLMAVFGGMGQLYGPIIGAVVFAYAERILLVRFHFYFMLAFGIIMIAVVLFLPGGLASLIERGRPRLRELISKLWKGGEAE